MGKLFVFYFIIGFFNQTWGSSQSLSSHLLNQVPRSYPTFYGFKSHSSCKNLYEPTRKTLLQLKKQGHELVLMMNTGSNQPMSRYQLRDSYLGQRFQRSEDMIHFLEKRALQAGVTSDQQRERLIKKCLHGKELSHSEKIIFPESCTQPNQSRFLHSGFVFLKPGTTQEPFVIHMYGDENFNYTRGSLRVESLTSYLAESALFICESQILQLKKTAQIKIKRFFEQNHASRLLASGKRSYNFVTHPWGLMTQNCNAWASEVLAASLFIESNQWNSVDRKTSKIRLWQTGFTPTKLPLTNLQSLAALPSLFIGGIDMNEGNFIHHPYAVADILPAQPIVNWLKQHSFTANERIIYGELK